MLSGIYEYSRIQKISFLVCLTVIFQGRNTFIVVVTINDPADSYSLKYEVITER